MFLQQFLFLIEFSVSGKLSIFYQGKHIFQDNHNHNYGNDRDSDDDGDDDDNGDVDHGDDYTDVNPVVTVRLFSRLAALWFRFQQLPRAIACNLYQTKVPKSEVV